MSTLHGRNEGDDTRLSRVIHGTADSRPLPLWVLQVTELVVAIVFVDISVHVSGGGLLVAAAAAFAALAVTAEGPLGLVRICPPRLHIALVVAVSVLVAAAPVVPALRPDVQGIIVVEFGAVGLIRVATLTRISEQRRGVTGTSRRPQRVIDTTASVVEPTARGHPSAPSRPAGDGTVRRAGRTAGAAAASGKRIVAEHRPGAEAHLKRTIRGAGRWVGRMAFPPDDGK